MHALILATGRNHTPNNEYALNNDIIFLYTRMKCCVVHVGEMASHAEDSFSLINVVRELHTYKSVLTPTLGEGLLKTMSKNNKHGFCVVKDGRTVNHVPHQLPRNMWHFKFTWRPGIRGMQTTSIYGTE